MILRSTKTSLSPVPTDHSNTYGSSVAVRLHLYVGYGNGADGFNNIYSVNDIYLNLQNIKGQN